MKKITRQQKKVMYKDIYDPNSDGKYAKKKKLQKKGIYNRTSPFYDKQ